MLVTPGFYLIALDPDTGRTVPGFGENGVVDLMIGVRGEVTATTSIGNSSPALVIGDVVVVGPAHEVGMRPRSKANHKGDVRGFDVRTGKLLWTFHTIPARGEPGYETWLNGSAENGSNAGVWAPMAADPELGLVYLPVETPLADTYGGDRPGDNLYGTSIVCVDAKTGERVWHHQLIHHDIWDWDNPTAPILMDLVVDGRPIKAVAQITKQAWVYTFDRVTGEPVWPIEERPVPAGDVPGEWYAATQPFPTKPPAFDRQGFTDDDLIDFTPALRAEAADLHAAVARGCGRRHERYARAAEFHRRRELGRRRVRSGNQDPLHRLEHEPERRGRARGAELHGHALHRGRRRAAAAAARPADHEAALRPDHRD